MSGGYAQINTGWCDSRRFTTYFATIHLMTNEDTQKFTVYRQCEFAFISHSYRDTHEFTQDAIDTIQPDTMSFTTCDSRRFTTYFTTIHLMTNEDTQEFAVYRQCVFASYFAQGYARVHTRCDRYDSTGYTEFDKDRLIGPGNSDVHFYRLAKQRQNTETKLNDTRAHVDRALSHDVPRHLHAVELKCLHYANCFSLADCSLRSRSDDQQHANKNVHNIEHLSQRDVDLHPNSGRTG